MKALPVNDCVAVMMQQQMVGVGLCNQDSHCPTFSCSPCVCSREREREGHVKHGRSAVKSIVSSRARTAVSSLLVEMLIFLILDLITDDIQRLCFTQNLKNVSKE